MEYKLVATDLDGTLLTTNKKITKNAINAILDIRKKGYKVVAVTARNLGSIKSVCDINIFDYLILNNGVSIVDIDKNEIISVGNLDKKTYTSITNDVIKDSIEIDYSSLNYYYVKDDKKTSMNIIRKQINNLEDIKEEVSRMNVFFNDEETLNEYKKKLQEKYKNLNIFEMQDSSIKYRWLVLNPINVNKASTLKLLSKKLKIKKEEIIFFGDSLNDLEVMNEVGCSVAMENAVDEVKSKASKITLSNDNDGVAKFLNNNLK